MKLSTIGYEGLKLDAFIALLREHGIQTVVDIREVPFSRKPGLSKKPLGEALAAAGLGYVHIVELGSPKAVRDRQKTEPDWDRYTAGFLEHLHKQAPALAQLARMAGESHCALLCFEADPNFCHRSIVAQAMHDQYGAEIRHLRAPGKTLPLAFG